MSDPKSTSRPSDSIDARPIPRSEHDRPDASGHAPEQAAFYLRSIADILQVPLDVFFEPGAVIERQRTDRGPDSLELIRHFGSIRDPELRRRILDLVQEAASNDGSED